MTFKKILITGAAGRVAQALRRGFGDRLGELRLTDIATVPQLAAHEQFVAADLTNPDHIAGLCDDIDAIIHLAGTPNAKDWATTNRLNIEVSQRLFDTAYKAGIKRIVYASSIHVFGMYKLGNALHADLPPRPDGYYGISKVFGEAALRYHADKHDITGVSVRIGSFRPVPGNVRELATWLSPDDCVSLFERALVAPVQGYFDPLGFSANTRLKINDLNWNALGYEPIDDGELYADDMAVPTEEEIRMWRLLGAHMTGPEY
ncbi:MAG: NAD(P)-dependent oxidoreductase [Herminiimonas sp.]|nr:NAD(P)-dependent oxidoreductase [Herminiimonas sp.]